ncbi:MAG: ornithine cyclodeaminase family protein [Alphaproteobacteria bacterium]|nr:ornithine cyclodeaminase family protein [Alphaproteobacteria bacterium]
MGVLLLKPADLGGLVTMRQAIDDVEQAYREAADYPVINAPRRRVHSPAGVRVSNFPGGVHGMGVIGAEVRAELVRQADGNQTYARREHPIYVLHDSSTGALLAIVIGEIDEKTLGCTSLMALRTAAASGVGFRHLVRRDATTAGLFGSAGQAANQLLALLTERPIRSVKVYSRDPANRRRFAETYGPKFGIAITPVDSPREVVTDVDVIVCATNTNVPLFDGDWLAPGQHVTGIIGSNVALVKGGFLKSRRRELDDRTAVRADVIVTNLIESLVTEEQGDLWEPIQKGLIPLAKVHELGQLLTGRIGRTSSQEITYHKNNNGTGVSEMAIAMRAYLLAKAAGRGTEIEL